MKLLSSTNCMNYYVNHICCIDRQIDFCMGKIPLLENASDKCTTKGFYSIGGDNSEPTTNTPTKILKFLF